MNGGASSSAGSPAAAQAAGSSGAPTLESAVLKELRAQLLAAHHERDDLLKDVEALCMQARASAPAPPRRVEPFLHFRGSACSTRSNPRTPAPCVCVRFHLLCESFSWALDITPLPWPVERNLSRTWAEAERTWRSRSAMDRSVRSALSPGAGQ